MLDRGWDLYGGGRGHGCVLPGRDARPRPPAGPGPRRLRPWSLLRTADGWVLIDWEDAAAAEAPFLDLCHYLVQGHAMLGRPSRQAVLDGFRDQRGWVGLAVAAYADGAGLPVA
jgi:hypothetical protein